MASFPTGITHAEDGRFWEAIRKWELALSLSEFSHLHCQHRGSVANGGNEERAKDDKLRDKIRFATSFDASEERVLDAQLLEMKAQVGHNGVDVVVGWPTPDRWYEV